MRRYRQNIFHRALSGNVTPDGVVPRKEMFYFSGGVIGQNISYSFIAGWIFYFYTDVLGIAAAAAGFLAGLSRILDALNDPLIGSLMDKHRFKNGEKFRPYLLTTPIFIGITAALMFTDFGIKNNTARIIYLFSIFQIWSIIYTYQDIAQWSMTSVITDSSNERASVMQLTIKGATIGSWIPGLVPIIISLTGMVNFDEKLLFLIFGITMAGGGMILSLFTYKARERVFTEKPKESFVENMGFLFKNKTVMLILLANILQSCAFSVPAVYFFKYKVSIDIFGIHMSGLSFSFIFGIITGLPGTLAMLFATKLAKLVGGMKNVLMIASGANLILRLIAFTIGYEGIDMLYVMLLLGISSIPFGLMGIASSALWGDSIDYMELQTGKRAEAITFAAQNFIAKATGGISTIVGGLTLAILKFDSKLYDLDLPQSDTFNKYIWPVFILGPALGSILYLIPMFFIKYNEKTRRYVEKALHIKRAAALEAKNDVAEKGITF